MVQAARASDRWSWHSYLMMMWDYFLCLFFFSLQILRRADKNGKYCRRAASFHAHTNTSRLCLVCKSRCAFSMKVWSGLWAFFVFVCFHGNRKMTMPIEVQFHNIIDVKHRKLVPVRHFCPDASHVKVMVAMLQRKICSYFTCVVQIKTRCTTSLQNTALNHLRCNFHFQPQTQNNLSDIRILM